MDETRLRDETDETLLRDEMDETRRRDETDETDETAPRGFLAISLAEIDARLSEAREEADTLQNGTLIDAFCVYMCIYFFLLYICIYVYAFNPSLG